jgi:carboxyl-terminal processing protease
MVALFLAAVLSLMCYTRADRNRYATTVSEAMDLIAFNYLEDVGYRDLYENAMRGMTEGLDPYSSYISPADYQRFQEDIDQEFGGIGILVEFNRETGRLVVMSPLFDTPAARAGVRAGDVILSIDGRDTFGMSFREAVEMIRGKPGEVVQFCTLANRPRSTWTSNGPLSRSNPCWATGGGRTVAGISSWRATRGSRTFD